MHSTEPYYRTKLKIELKVRMDRNALYSIRAFAQFLSVEPSSLSQILAGKRSISVRLAERFCDKFALGEREQQKFMLSIIQEKKSLGISKVNKRLEAYTSKNAANLSLEAPTWETEDLDPDKFRIISDWYHNAILEMTFKPDFKADPRWIAEKLSITVTEAKMGLERLFELNLLTIRGGKTCKTKLTLDTKDKSSTSTFHRKRQSQILLKSLHCLENESIQERQHSAVTLCIDSRLIAKAKTRIQEVIWQLGQEFMDQGTPDRVYEFTMQLFPLEKKENAS